MGGRMRRKNDRGGEVVDEHRCGGADSSCGPYAGSVEHVARGVPEPGKTAERDCEREQDAEGAVIELRSEATGRGDGDSEREDWDRGVGHADDEGGRRDRRGGAKTRPQRGQVVVVVAAVLESERENKEQRCDRAGR